MMKNLNLQIPIEVDGGVSSANAVLLKDAGADILVAGSSVFGAADRKKRLMYCVHRVFFPCFIRIVCFYRLCAFCSH